MSKSQVELALNYNHTIMEETMLKFATYLSAAVVMTAIISGSSLAQLSLAPNQPQPGQCKAQAVTAPAQPQDRYGRPVHWMNKVAGMYGTNWSIWPAAKDKKIFQVSRTQIASARPCFMLPVP